MGFAFNGNHPNLGEKTRKIKQYHGKSDNKRTQNKCLQDQRKIQFKINASMGIR